MSHSNDEDCNTEYSHIEHIDFRARTLLGRMPRSFIQSLYRDCISVEVAVESNIDGIRCQDWIPVEDECFNGGDWTCVNCQVKQEPSDRRSSEVRDYVRSTMMIDIPHELPITDAMSVVYEGIRWKIISVVDDLDVATRLVVELREE